ncbi:MAG: hypothetical protein HW375_2164 [Anaerolineales bacterium]|nr:hypothetical protein [Anaerolineales bacterium]
MPRRQAGGPAPDYDLVRRFEPILRFTEGELYFPTDVDRYVESSSLWVNHRDGGDEQLLSEGEVTLENLGVPRDLPPGAVEHLRFVGQASLRAEMRRALRERNFGGRARRRGWVPGQGRLARVGLFSRVVDAGFALTLLGRGRVPTAVASLAEKKTRAIDAGREIYSYYARVIRDGGWIGLQYWYFYRYDDWRTSFEGVNDHEADWETISVYLYRAENGSLTPRWVVFSCHEFAGSDLRRRWDDREQLDLVGEHPVAYVGAGSHAHYFRPGEYLIEAEVPPLKRLAGLIQTLRAFWAKVVRQGTAGGLAVRNVLAIPFVEYARGDGPSLGPGQDQEWQAVLLDPAPKWLHGYRGLWGLYVRDPMGGENAPAGPMFNRDGTPRGAWYDPLAYSGLNLLLPPPAEKKRLAFEQRRLARRQRQLREQIEEKLDTVQARGVVRQAYEGFPALQREAQTLAADLAVEAGSLKAMRRELSQNEAVAAAFGRRLDKIRLGEEDPPHAHIRVLQTPSTSDELRFVRLTEFWSAITIGLLVIGFILLVQLAPGWILAGGLTLLVAVALIESILRGSYSRVIRDITVGLAALTLLLLIYEYLRVILIGGLVIGVLVLTLQNLREALAPVRKRKRRKRPAPADPSKG